MMVSQIDNKKAYIIDTTDYSILQSYQTIVACIENATGKIYVRDWYSTTTSQHINRFFKARMWNINKDEKDLLPYRKVNHDKFNHGDDEFWTKTIDIARNSIN